MLISLLVRHVGCSARQIQPLAGLALFVLVISSMPGAPSLREVLSPEDFARAGLNRLTDAELAFLSARLVPPAPPMAAERERVGVMRPREDAPPVAETALPRGEAAFGRDEQVLRIVEREQQIPGSIQTRIEGRFTGWSGHTTFRLANGQVWQQAEAGDFTISLDAPAATIRKGRFGTYFFGIAGYGSEVKVKRIK